LNRHLVLRKENAMPADDRDQKFDRALAQHLRRGSVETGCPDAETLAAYQERSLSLDEMAQWKQHIAGCAACQETLALVETTEKQLAEEWNEEPIPVMQAAMRSPIPRKTAAASGPAPVEKMRRPALLRWAVPVGAIAAGVLVWIGIHEQHDLYLSKPARDQVALNREPAPDQKISQAAPTPAAPPAERDDRSKQLDAEAARKELEAARNEPRDAKREAPYPMADRLKKDSQPANGVGAGKGSAAGAGALPYSATSPSVSQNRPVLRAETPTSASESIEMSAPPPRAPPPGPAAPAPSKPAPGATGNAVGGVSGDRMTDADINKAAKAKSKAQMQQQAAAESVTSEMRSQGINGRDTSSLMALASQRGVIPTPDNKVWWKLGAGGTVELTTDAGKTWKTLDTGTGSEFTAGFAPSSKVNWIVGKAGTLLLTTDRGKHWKKIATPITGDLGGVHAVDAKRASIWDAANRLSYETRDGGTTWTQVANQ
jgi:hypothetical protein